eukprot:949101-Amphidinium_carterae.2
MQFKADAHGTHNGDSTTCLPLLLKARLALQVAHNITNRSSHRAINSEIDHHRDGNTTSSNHAQTHKDTIKGRTTCQTKEPPSLGTQPNYTARQRSNRICPKVICNSFTNQRFQGVS